MATMNEYELNCLIEGEEDTLIVSVSSAAKVKELKQVIFREGELDALHYPRSNALEGQPRVFISSTQSVTCLTH